MGLVLGPAGGLGVSNSLEQGMVPAAAGEGVVVGTAFTRQGRLTRSGEAAVVQDGPALLAFIESRSGRSQAEGRPVQRLR